jgi:DNA-binding NarL/FixJ family response regulator
MGISGLRVYVVEDHEVAIVGLSQRISQLGHMVVGSSSSGRDAIEEISKANIDVLLLDIRIKDLDGLKVLEELRITHPHLPVVLLSSYDNPTYIASAVALGANDYLLKSDGTGQLDATLQRACKQEPPPESSVYTKIRSTLNREVTGSAIQQLPIPLTGRELQVLKHIALGLSNKEIATSLSISVETVKEHVQNVLRKLGARDRTDAAVRAIRGGYVND